MYPVRHAALAPLSGHHTDEPLQLHGRFAPTHHSSTRSRHDSGAPLQQYARSAQTHHSHSALGTSLRRTIPTLRSTRSDTPLSRRARHITPTRHPNTTLAVLRRIALARARRMNPRHHSNTTLDPVRRTAVTPRSRYHCNAPLQHCARSAPAHRSHAALGTPLRCTNQTIHPLRSDTPLSHRARHKRYSDAPLEHYA